MKEVKVFSLSHNWELYIHITDQIEEDFKTCMELAAQAGARPTCNLCSWGDLTIDNGSQWVAMCTLPDVRKTVTEEMDESSDEISGE